MKRIKMLQDDSLGEDEPLYLGNVYLLDDSKADELIGKGKGEVYNGPT